MFEKLRIRQSAAEPLSENMRKVQRLGESRRVKLPEVPSP